MNDFSGNLKLALPNKGALSEGAVNLLIKAGYRCKRSGRELVIRDAENKIDFVFLRPRDIALYVGSGIIDVGITGIDLAMDSGAEVETIFPLGFGKSRFCFAAPKEKNMSIADFNGLRIATSYPSLLKNELAKRNLNCKVVKLDGAVEISIALGVADAIADVVESGATMREAGLEIVGEPMLHSEAVVIAGNSETAKRPEVALLIARLTGIMRAAEYVMVEYDIERSKLEEACKITPGIESPTIAPLSNPDWVAVKSMVKRKESNAVMDQLYELGGRGIIIMEISACRL
ncbi:MAG: ATP phosphoribosyltransferase [Lentisphaeria bacterium]|nr:ATP phosphoribosyltransferase [Lentisphaerota bacterium]MBR2625401.1 ATP phosphoribosyltransferase [Lentisphaeria bacterium]